MAIKAIKHILFFFFVLQLWSCSEYQQVLKSTDADYKYQKAVEYYEKAEWDKAFPLFDELLTLYRGTEKAADVYYYYAMTSFEMEDFILAAYHFKNFAKTFANHEKTEEAYYMVGYCNYLESPEYSLDQDFTYKAINDLQLFANLYPNSDKLFSVNELIEDLRGKLERKSFEKAKLYFNTEYYQAAVVAFNNTLDEYPDTEYREEALYLRLQASFRLAENSISEKKYQRFVETRTAYKEFVQSYPDSPFRKEVERQDLLKRIEQNINALQIET